MTQLLSPDTFEFFARYLLAGFIMLSVRSWFIAGARPKAGEVILDSVILSLISQAVFQVLIWATKQGDAVQAASSTSDPIFFLETLVLPAILGAALGKGLSSEKIAIGLRRLALPNSHPAERAYDFAFSNLDSPRFVIVSYKDGTVIHGYFGQRSLAATDGNRSDILLERLYEVTIDGEWSESQPARTALLMIQDIRSIEFLEPEVSSDDT